MVTGRTRPTRVVSRAYASLMVGGALIFTTVLALVALTRSGTALVAWVLMAGSLLATAVALVVFLAWPRSTTPMSPGADGVVRVAAPAALVGAGLSAWFLALAAAGVWGWLAVTDFSRLDPAGPLIVVVLGSIATLPAVWQLLTGRLHRWRVELDDDGLTYQGLWRRVEEPWSAVRAVTVSTDRRTAGVVVDLKASRPDVVVPWAAFLVDPTVLAAEIAPRIRR